MFQWYSLVRTKKVIEKGLKAMRIGRLCECFRVFREVLITQRLKIFRVKTKFKNRFKGTFKDNLRLSDY